MKSKYWFIIIFAVLAAAAGAVYYSNQPALDLGPITIHRKPQSPTTISSPMDINGWKTYTNSQYGFSLKFPHQWSGMKVKDNGLSFYLPYADDLTDYGFICGIQTYTQDDWDSLQNEDSPHSTDIIMTDQQGNIFTYVCGQDDYGFAGFDDYNNDVKLHGYGSSITGPYKEFETLIIPTFKFIK